jgi:sodium pump decarboxylase gamma subunit
VIAVVFCLSACGNTQEAVTYDTETLSQASDFLLEYCASADEATIEQWKELPEFSLELQLVQAGLPFTPDSFLDALDAWQAATKECGVFIQHDAYEYEASTSEIKVTTNAWFEERTAKITLIYDENMYLDSVTIDADYTKVEILKKAGLNTVLGMGTVFVVLIFISLLISCFKYIPAIEESFKNRKLKKNGKMEPTGDTAVTDQDEIALEEDMELVAVIAAAIAAAEGTTTDGFVVRSIRRRPSNRW